MKKLIKLSLLTITLVLIVVSCAYHKPQERSIATQSKHQCMDSVKGEYQSYFDSVETCIEKDSNK